MNCLNECENDVLNVMLGNGDKYTPQYHCAESLSPTYKAGEVADAFATLLHLGLVRQSGEVVKISAPAMGDVAKGYFNIIGNETPELLELQGRILEVERAHLEAVEKAAALPPAGGLAPSKK